MIVDYSLPPTEAEVGITLYADTDNDHIILPCIFKHKYQDFHVYEIPEDNNRPLHLTKLWTKDNVIKEIRDKRDNEDDLINTLGPDYKLNDEQINNIKQCLNEDDMNTFITFLKTPHTSTSTPSASAAATATRKYCLLQGDTIQDKPGRTKVHKMVKTQFPNGMFISDTIDPDTDNDNKYKIRIWIKKDFNIGQKRARELAAINEDDNKRHRGKKGGKRGAAAAAGGGGSSMKKLKKVNDDDVDLPQARYDPWPKDQGDYLYFNMYKENRDTSEAITIISKAMGKKNNKSFTIAGTKDRRAVTVQQVCMWRTYEEQVKRAILNGKWDRCIRVSDFHYKNDKLSLGMLYGNRFYVALRGIKELPDKDKLDKAFNNVSNKGFINYFGMQRFGTQLTRTHEIGRAMLANDWEKTIRLIMGETSMIRQAATSAAAATSEENKEEGGYNKVNEARKAYLIDNDANKSLQLMPNNMHIEKKLMSLLAKEPHGYLAALQQLSTPTLSLYVHSLQSYIWNHAVSYRITKYGINIVNGDIVINNRTELISNNNNDYNSKHNDNIIHITDDNIKDYNIYDVVLPLPGDNTEYPNNMEQWYIDFVNDNLSLSLINDFKTCNTSGGVFNLTGSYRNILSRCDNVEYDIISKDKALDRTLIPTDIDIINKRDYSIEKLDNNDISLLENTYSIIFKTTLKSGTYLTMALREITRQDTSRNSIINNNKERKKDT